MVLKSLKTIINDIEFLWANVIVERMSMSVRTLCFTDDKVYTRQESSFKGKEMDNVKRNRFS